MRNIIFITNDYPYSENENRVEQEINNLSNYFNVNVISLSNQKKKISKLPDNVKVFRLKQLNIFLRVFILFSVFFKKIFFVEVLFLLKSFQFRYKQMLFLIKSLYTSGMLGCFFYKNKNVVFNDGDIFYTYNFGLSNAFAIKLKKKYKNLKFVFRDLIEEDIDYSTFSPISDEIFDKIIFNSKHSYSKYMARPYFNTDNYCKYEVCPEGIIGDGNNRFEKFVGEPFRLVSFFQNEDIEYINRLTDALSMINDINIKWDNISFSRIAGNAKDLIKAKLCNNKSVRFNFIESDHCTYSDTLKQNPYDLVVVINYVIDFPEYVLRCMMNYIPVFRCDFGAMKEICIPNQSKVICENDLSTHISKKLVDYFYLTSDVKLEHRSASYRFFNKNYNKLINNEKIINTLFYL